MDLHEGGTSIPYWLEDPYIREEFESLLESNGAKTRMEPEQYERPEDLPDKFELGAEGIAG